MRNLPLVLFLIVAIHFTARAQEGNKIKVKGTVLDEKEEYLPGANIIEEGTSNGTTTDFDGNFELEVAKDAVLKVSFLGYETKKVEVNGQKELKIKMKEAFWK